jgi:hypothetical protein
MTCAVGNVDGCLDWFLPLPDHPCSLKLSSSPLRQVATIWVGQHGVLIGQTALAATRKQAAINYHDSRHPTLPLKDHSISLLGWQKAFVQSAWNIALYRPFE